jgi:hypothetical protein
VLQAYYLVFFFKNKDTHAQSSHVGSEGGVDADDASGRTSTEKIVGDASSLEKKSEDGDLNDDPSESKENTETASDDALEAGELVCHAGLARFKHHSWRPVWTSRLGRILRQVSCLLYEMHMTPRGVFVLCRCE